MRAFADPAASVDRDGAGDEVGADFEIIPAPQDADMGSNKKQFTHRLPALLARHQRIIKEKKI